ncbi:Uncharacterized protein OBRU01_02080 [Operophtera brumata]|uniref:MGA conserved domain-containing protein n=1 Tax=Operophtera brumata TaxID=104452 RepID=A0A0L7LMI5_OPEBR|nr:Uncharacterized protein OBRU01_02080 [Operophtera brumata]
MWNIGDVGEPLCMLRPARIRKRHWYCQDSTMEDGERVFYSDITRVDLKRKNNLDDLLNITPATPIPIRSSENASSLFEPRSDKYYVPKKRSRLKVRTVREIRNLFEQENYNFIIEDMEKQQSTLISKIRTGSATDDNTKNMAKKLLNADHPITRTAWQMLNNINPDKNMNPTQFVLWNGRRIRVVGSRGGKTKFICHHDLGNDNVEETKKKCFLTKYTKKKQGLLRNSLNIKFKPGPLRLKKNLDESHQKYHLGPIELVKLPKPALDIQPTYGTVVEPIMANFLNKLRAQDGTVSEKWAELAVSVLGTVQNNNIVQNDIECCVTFDLSYKCDQNRILMRRDISNVSTNSDNATYTKCALQNESDDMPEIKNIIENILDSVEISLKQDCMYSMENESPRTTPEPFDYCNINLKEKNKKKYGELDRLAVTVIQLPAAPTRNPPKLCGKSYCSLGCICDSLNCTYKFKQHCGYLECMFGCKCELSKYKDIELLENSCAELIPGLMKLDSEINSNLAKEEQKFHQTVVFSGETSILLKSRKRNLKSSKKYAEFYSTMRLKNEKEPKKILTIVDKKLNCSNIEPWCMVHNLYKCFCKRRFTETSVLNMAASLPITNIIAEPEHSNPSDPSNVDTKQDIRNVLRKRVRHSRESSEKRRSLCVIECNVSGDDNRDASSDTCARTNKYAGRKFDESYYKTTNNKILEMEKNDTQLQKKITRLMKNTLESSPSSSNVILLTDNSDSKIGNESKKEYNYRFYKNKNNKNVELEKNDMELLENNSTLIENTEEPSSNLCGVAKLDLSENSEDCINIDAIRFADLHKYPCVVKKLLTNTTNKDYFCILGGWDDCWEIIGSVKKNDSVSDDRRSDTDSSNNESTSHGSDFAPENWCVKEADDKASSPNVDCLQEINKSTSKMINLERSKWFLIKLENDFTEIYCHKKGFYVERQKILHAINLARITRKTVVINKQTCTEITGIPFGIYALPDTTEYCAAVGPYEIDESLGLEIVKSSIPIEQKSTTGFWITTNKVDNVKVLDDPLSFLPPKTNQKELRFIKAVKLAKRLKHETDNVQPSTSQETDIKKIQNRDCSSKDTDGKKIPKMVKPIKIRRTNGFYHLTSKSNIIKNLSQNSATSLVNEDAKEKNADKPILINYDPKSLYNIAHYSHHQILNTDETNAHLVCFESAAATSHLKITSVYSESVIETEKPKNEEKKTGMFVLKPEEINMKASDYNNQTEYLDNENKIDEIGIDIESFLSSTNIFVSPRASSASESDVLLISDEENEDDKKNDTQEWADVWIQCSNIHNLGWIRGRRNKENLLSIDFPGFKRTNLYNESEAFEKINQ